MCRGASAETPLLLRAAQEAVARAHPDVAMIFNCAGLAAGSLAADAAIYPIKGQVVHVEAPWIRMALADVDTGAYVIPFPGDTLECGGIAHERDYDRRVRREDTDTILSKVAHMVPSLSYAGLRGGSGALSPSQ